MSDERVFVQVDDRLRLLSAALAVTDWPEREQERQPHGVHAHAKATRKYLAEYAEHPASLALQALIGHVSLSDLFAYACRLSWPGLRARGEVPAWAPNKWAAQLRNFYHTSRLPDLWHSAEAVWEAARHELENVLAQHDMAAFLEQFFGPLTCKLFFQPNLCYPTDDAVSFKLRGEIWCIAPPPLAYGHNPPWPYDADPAWVYRVALGQFATVLLRDYLAAHPDQAAQAQGGGALPVPNDFRASHPDWFDQFAMLFVGGATALFLEKALGQAEVDAFIMMEHRTRGFTFLPSVVNVLRRYLSERQAGRFDEFADYLPAFRNNLRVTNKLNNL